MAVWSIKTSAAAVSPTIYEAAKISDAKGYQTFFRITPPLLVPGIAAGWILAFFVGFRELVMSALVRPSGASRESPTHMYAMSVALPCACTAPPMPGLGLPKAEHVRASRYTNRAETLCEKYAQKKSRPSLLHFGRKAWPA